MEMKAVNIIQFTVAGKFCAALFLRPNLTGCQKQAGEATSAVEFLYITPFQISHRRTV